MNLHIKKIVEPTLISSKQKVKVKNRMFLTLLIFYPYRSFVKRFSRHVKDYMHHIKCCVIGG